jgi:peptidoglycan-associated lipoprotein
MILRSLLILTTVLTLSACSSDEEGAIDNGMNGAGTNIDGSLNGGTGFGDGLGGAGVGSVTPGSQQDLAVNVGDRVFFEVDQSDVTGEGQSTLDRQASWLKQYPNVALTVEGHADERGTREYNLALGERRAASIKNYLMSQGIDASRLNTISYGKERPAVTESNAEGWSQNRRGLSVVN